MVRGVKTRAEGELIQGALRLLEELGPQTAVEVAREQGVHRNSAANSLSRLRGRGLIHISDWTRTVEGERMRIRAIYSHGPGKDKKKPPREPRATKQRRLYGRNKAMVNSVFAYGQNKKARRKLVKVAC
jgi:hypothetical protein